MRSNLPVINVYKKKGIKSKLLTTQLLYGDSFKKIQHSKSWLKIKNNLDNYKGYIKNKKFYLNEKNSHKVYILCAKLYSKPNNNNKIKKKLSFASKIKVIKRKGD